MLARRKKSTLQVLLMVTLACTHSRALSNDVFVKPLRELQGCVLVQPVPEVVHPWAGVDLDASVDSSVVGFGQLIRFRLDPSGLAGRAAVVRMSNPSSGDSLFRGEKRVWAVAFDTDDSRNSAVSYSYVSPSRSDDLWVRRSTERAVVRSRIPHVDHATPLERACDTIQRAFPGERVMFDERSTGSVQSTGDLVRFLTHHVPSESMVDRLIKRR